MMDRQFAQVGAGELAAAAAADPWIDFQSPLPIALLARFGTAARVRHYPIELARIVRFRATHSNPPEGFFGVLNRMSASKARDVRISRVWHVELKTQIGESS